MPVPIRHPIINVIGIPIPVEKIENPTQEQICALHERVVRATVSLYERRRGLIGWENKDLVLD